MTEDSAWMNSVWEALEGDPDGLDTILIEQNKAEKVQQLNKLRDGTRVLHTALGNSECLKVLLRHGAEPSKKSKSGLQPLHVAVMEDYVEAMMILCNHDANINALTDDKKTPLQIAAAQNSTACYDLLHFLGARMPDSVVDDLLKNERKQDYLIIQQGYKGKKIRNARVMVDITDQMLNVRDRFNKPIGVVIDKPQEAFHILVCRMEPEYQSRCMRIPKVEIPEGTSLISDIYQYKVDKDVRCDMYFDVTISKKHVNNEYKEIIVRQESDNNINGDDLTSVAVYTDVNYVNDKQVFVSDFCLLAGRSSPVVAFAVFVRNRIDTTIVEPDKTTIISSTKEPTFQLRAEPGSELSNRRIELQVVEVDSSDDSSDSGIGSHSDFCSIQSFDTRSSVSTPRPPSSVSNSRPQTASSTRSMDYKVVVTLPIPIKLPNGKVTSEDQPHVLACGQGDEQNFYEHKNVETGEKNIKAINAKEGSYIVILAQRVTEFIKEKVRAMWESANGCKKMCKVFATVEPLGSTELTSSYRFLVTVHLCLEEDYSKKCNDILQESLKLPKTERSVKSSCVGIEMNIKLTYLYNLDVKHGEIEGAKEMPIQYQEGQDKAKQFKVSTEDKLKLAGVVKISKSSKISFSKTKTKLPIEFVPNKVQTITGNMFLNDDYVENVLAEKIGGKWFTFGICLGLPFEKLETYEDIKHLERCKQVLYCWREDQYGNGERQRLDRFIKATFDAEMPTLREELLENHILKYMKTNKDIKTWVTQHRTKTKNGNVHFDFLPLKSKEVSPLDDKFLVFAAKCMVLGEIEAISMGLPGNEVTDITQKKNVDIYYTKCKLLSRFRDKCQGRLKFLKELMGYLKREKQNVTIDEITAGVKQWLDTSADRENKTLLSPIFK